MAENKVASTTSSTVLLFLTELYWKGKGTQVWILEKITSTKHLISFYSRNMNSNLRRLQCSSLMYLELGSLDLTEDSVAG